MVIRVSEKDFGEDGGSRVASEAAVRLPERHVGRDAREGAEAAERPEEGRGGSPRSGVGAVDLRPEEASGRHDGRV